MKNKIIPTIAVYLGKEHKLTIHKTRNQAYTAFMNAEIYDFIVFRHTSLDEIMSMTYEQAIETETTREAKING